MSISQNGRRRKEGHGNSERWLLTYSDMITLLMIFFIVMYSMSSIDNQKFKQISESLSVVMGGNKPLDVQGGFGEGESISGPQSDPTDSFVEMKKEIETFIQNNNLGGNVSTTVDQRGIVVTLNEAILFDKGSAQILPEHNGIIKKLTDILKQSNNYIRVEGYTDDLPISSKEFPSNWELASQRAINVAKLLISYQIKPERISTMSYGEYRPSVENDSEENRRKNRKVDIIIVNQNNNHLEPATASGKE